MRMLRGESGDDHLGGGQGPLANSQRRARTLDQSGGFQSPETALRPGPALVRQAAGEDEFVEVERPVGSQELLGELERRRGRPALHQDAIGRQAALAFAAGRPHPRDVEARQGPGEVAGRRDPGSHQHAARRRSRMRRQSLETRAADRRDSFALVVEEIEVGGHRARRTATDVNQSRADPGAGPKRADLVEADRHEGAGLVIGLVEQKDQPVETGIQPRGVEAVSRISGTIGQFGDDDVPGDPTCARQLAERGAELQSQSRRPLIDRGGVLRLVGRGRFHETGRRARLPDDTGARVNDAAAFAQPRAAGDFQRRARLRHAADDFARGAFAQRQRLGDFQTAQRDVVVAGPIARDRERHLHKRRARQDRLVVDAMIGEPGLEFEIERAAPFQPVGRAPHSDQRMRGARAVDPGRFAGFPIPVGRARPGIRWEIDPRAGIGPESERWLDPRADDEQPLDAALERIAPLALGAVLEREIDEGGFVQPAGGVADMIAQRRPRSDLEENARLPANCVLDPFLEAHRLAHVSPPIMRVGADARQDLVFDGRQESHGSRARLETGQTGEQRLSDRVHVGAMEGIGEVEPRRPQPVARSEPGQDDRALRGGPAATRHCGELCAATDRPAVSAMRSSAASRGPKTTDIPPEFAVHS